MMTTIPTTLFKALSEITKPDKAPIGNIAIDQASNGLAATDGHVAVEITDSDKDFNYKDALTAYGYNTPIDDKNLTNSRKQGKAKKSYNLDERYSEAVNYPNIAKLFRNEKKYKNWIVITQELLDTCLNLTAGNQMEDIVTFFVNKESGTIELVLRMMKNEDSFTYLGIKTDILYDGSLMNTIKDDHQFLFSFNPQNLAKIWDIINNSGVKINLEHVGMHFTYGSPTTPFIFKADSGSRKIRCIGMPAQLRSKENTLNALAKV